MLAVQLCNCGSIQQLNFGQCLDARLLILLTESFHWESFHWQIKVWEVRSQNALMGQTNSSKFYYYCLTFEAFMFIRDPIFWTLCHACIGGELEILSWHLYSSPAIELSIGHYRAIMAKICLTCSWKWPSQLFYRYRVRVRSMIVSRSRIPPSRLQLWAFFVSDLITHPNEVFKRGIYRLTAPCVLFPRP